MAASAAPTLPPARRIGTDRLALVAVGVLTAVALALRIPGLAQSLVSDEVYTHTIVTGNGIGGVWHEVYETSVTPPLHYYVAWLSTTLGGDSITAVRLPSLVFGTLLVPLVFGIGRKVEGVRAGLIGAAIITLGPFSIWYSNEARAYAQMMFLLALAVLALLYAVDRGDRRLWALYAVAGAASLWSHYTSVFVIVVSATWALWAMRDRWRTPAIAIAAMALLYLPWVPGYLNQRKNGIGLESIDLAAHGFSWAAPARTVAQTLVGNPAVGLERLPGGFGLLLFGLVVALLVPLLWKERDELLELARLRPATVLIVGLAVATPVGLLLYAAGGKSFFIPRNLSASLPAVAVLAGIVMSRLTRALPAAVGAAALTTLAAIGIALCAHGLTPEFRRFPIGEATRWSVARARPGDWIVESALVNPRDRRVGRGTLGLYFSGHDQVRLAGFGFGDGPAWHALRARRQVFVVGLSAVVTNEALERALEVNPIPALAGMLHRADQVGGPNGLALRRETDTFAGLPHAAAVRFKGLARGRISGPPGRRTIAWTFGRRIAVRPDAVRGSVEQMTPSGTGAVTVAGTAVGTRSRAPVDWVLLFADNRLIGTARLGGERPGAAALLGPRARLAGFLGSSQPAPTDHARVRVFGVVGNRATELRRTGPAAAAVPYARR